MSRTEQRLATHGLELPDLPPPLGNYLPGRVHGDVLHLSGQTPQIDGRPSVTGLLGDTVDVAEGRDAARLAMLHCLAQARALLGDLDRVVGALRLTGYVAAVPSFTDHPAVIDGASEVLVAAYGEAGRHARSAIGVGSLPAGAPVEVDLVLLVSSETGRMD